MFCLPKTAWPPTWERLIERICKFDPGRPTEEFEQLSVGELEAMLRLAQAQEIRRQQRLAAGA